MNNEDCYLIDNENNLCKFETSTSKELDTVRKVLGQQPQDTTKIIIMEDELFHELWQSDLISDK